MYQLLFNCFIPYVVAIEFDTGMEFTAFYALTWRKIITMFYLLLGVCDTDAPDYSNIYLFSLEYFQGQRSQFL